MNYSNITINGTSGVTWGLVMDETSVAKLMTYPPAKEYIKNKSRLENGTRYVNTIPRFDEQTINLVVYIIANNKTQFMQRYYAFCEDVLKGGTMNISVDEVPDKVFHCLYKSCTEVGYFNGAMAKFTLCVVEPDPTDR